MNITDIIQNYLAGNQDISFNRDYRMYVRRDPSDRFDSVVRFHVAPKNGLYTAEELNSFMLSLVPELKPASTQPFYDDGTKLNLGQLFYQEKIKASEDGGRCRDLPENALIKPEDMIVRATFIKPFPNIALKDKAVVMNENMAFVLRHTLKQYQNGQIDPDAFRANIIIEI